MPEKSALLRMPALTLKGITIFPRMVLHFDAQKGSASNALDAAMREKQTVFLATRKELQGDEPRPGDIYDVGTICHIRQILKLPGDSVRVLVEGSLRARAVEFIQNGDGGGYLEASLELLGERRQRRGQRRSEALIRITRELFSAYSAAAPRLSSDVVVEVSQAQDPGYLADFIAQNIAIKYQDKQQILEELNPTARLEKVCAILSRETEILELEQDIQNRVRGQISKNYRDYYLKEQIKILQYELGEREESGGDTEDYRDSILALRLDGVIEEKLLKEASRLSRLQFGSPEGAVIRTYLDTVLELPWHKRTKERADIDAARKILENDHFGLQKVKDRILEYIAVKQLAPDLKGQILCLVGPPGVGKTSVAMSMARAMNRKLARLSLGGVRDEADIRGHRKTYVGAMPGRLINALKTSGSLNPLILLDEIDKMGSDFRGDPSAALLEVLDSEQNHAFRDHYLEIPVDLSDVIFVTTANTTQTIPRPLLDRMEIIELVSYTDEEKLQIAKRHLLPKQLKKHGLKKPQLKLSDEMIREIIAGYTRESGVRRLERELGAICRRAAKRIVEGENEAVKVTSKNLEDLLGVRKYKPERKNRPDEVGVVSGLAWTKVGGEILEVEVCAVPGTGKIELTGNLGDVMKESARAALSYIRSRAAALKIDPEFYKTRDMHIHFPEGAIPKDGPSAGIAIATAMISALTGAPARAGVAMTGEVTIRGRVLPIGGLKEKTMAAFRSGIKTVIIPAENESDLREIDRTVYGALSFICVESMDDVISTAIDFTALSSSASADRGAEAAKKTRRAGKLPPVAGTADSVPQATL